jgi:hypothetical protein
MTTTARRTRASIALTAAVAIGACGASGDARPPGEAGATGVAGVAAAGAGPQSGRPPVPAFKKGNPCSLLLPNEVGQILGAKIAMREIVDESTCSFPFDAAPANSAATGDPPQLTITVHWDDGPTAVSATRMASKLFGGDAGFEKLPGIGDEAWLGPLASMLVFSKGKVGIEIDLRMIPDGREKGIRLAKLIASRLP